jgi:hypothetical protein
MLRAVILKEKLCHNIKKIKPRFMKKYRKWDRSVLIILYNILSDVLQEEIENITK